MSSPVFDLSVSESGFVFDSRTGATFSVNPTGLLILTALRNRTDVSALPDVLRQNFEATPAEVPEHVDDFLRMLRQLGISFPGASGEDSAPHGGGR
jgi:PqqD family protein of HPr-rel-A system